MIYKFKIYPETGTLEESFSGEITLHELRAINDEIFADPDFRYGLNVISDVREAEINFGYDVMLAHMHSLPPLKFGKHAIVVSNKVMFGMIRMHITVTQDAELYEKSEPFYSLEEARDWIRGS